MLKTFVNLQVPNTKVLKKFTPKVAGVDESLQQQCLIATREHLKYDTKTAFITLLIRNIDKW